MNATFSGNMTLTGSSGLYTQAASGATLNVSGAIGESGSGFGLTMNAASNPITLSGVTSNTYTGATIANTGVTILNKSGGAVAISGPVTMGGVNTNQPSLRMSASDQFASGVVMTFANAAGNFTRFELLGTSQTLAGIQGTTGSGVIQNGGLAAGSATNATLTINNSASYSYNGLLRDFDGTNSGGVLNIVKTGIGTQTFAGTNISYTGSTSINGGVLSVDTLAPNATNSQIGAGTALNFDGGTLRYTGASNGNDTLSVQFNRAISVGSNGGTIDVGGSGFLFYNGTLTGSGALSVVDTSGDANNQQLLVTGNSPGFSGAISIGNGTANSGFVQQRTSAASPLGTGTITLNGGGVLSADNGSTNPSTLSNAIILNGGTLVTQAPAMIYSGTVTVNASTTSSVGHAFNGAGDVVLSGNISGSGTISAIGGSGVFLSGDNSGFTGTWQSTSAQTWFNTATAGSAAAKWVANGSNFIGNIAGGGTVSLGELSGTTGTLKNDRTGTTFTFSVGALNTNSSFSGGITDKTGDATSKTALTKVGNGILTLTGANSYTGGTTVSAGTLQIGNAAVNGTIGTGNYSIAGGAKLYLNYATAVAPTWANISGAGTLQLNSAQAVNASANWNQLNFGGGFMGTLLVEKGRVHSTASSQLGGATAVTILNGAQFLTFSASITFSQAFNIAGTGWGETNYESAIRFGNGGETTTFTGGVTLSADATIGGGGTGVFTNVISGANTANLTLGTVAGAGTVTFSGANTYSGNTTVAFGTLKLGAANVIPDGAGKGNLTVNASRTFDLNTFSETINGLSGAGTVDNVSGAGTPVLTVGNNDATSSFSGVIKNTTGTLALTKTGAGVLTLSGANAYTGATNINGGTLSVATALVANGSNSALGAGTTLTFDNNGIFRYTGASAPAFNRNITLNSGGGTMDQSNGGFMFWGGTVSGSGGLTKIGASQLIISGNNNYSGITNINVGQIQLRNSNALGTTAGKTIVADGANLSAGGGSTMTIPENIDLNGTGGGSGALQSNDAGTVATYSGTITLVTTSGVGGGTNFTISGPIGGGGGLTKLTGNTVTLSAANTYDGGTVVNAGTLALSGSGTFGATSGLLTADGASAIVNLGGSTQTVGAVSLKAGAAINNGTLTGTSYAVESGSVSANLGGGGITLTKTTGSTVTLTGTNTYTGATNINGGILSVASLLPNASNSGIGTGTAVTLNGGSLRYTGGNNGNDTLSAQFNRAITVGSGGGTIDVGGSGFLFYNGTLTGSGALSVVDTSGDANNQQLLVTGNSPGFSGAISIGNGTANSGWVQQRTSAASPLGTGSVTINTGGILSADGGNGIPTTLANNLILNGGTLLAQTPAINYTGSITANPNTTSFFQTAANIVLSGNLLGAGTIQKTGNANSIELRGSNGGFTGTYNHTADGATLFYTAASASAAASWNIPTGSNANARFMAAAADATYQLGALSGTTGRVENLNAGSGNSIFEIGALNTNTTFAGTIINGAGGTVGLTKVGNGILALSGANTYTGPTIVSAGTFLVSGSISGSVVSINGGILGGSGGTVSATTVNSGGTLAPGSSIGTLNFSSSLTLGGTSAFEINKTGITLTSDLANVAGTLALGGILNVTAGGDALTPGDTFNLFDAAIFSGNFSTVNLPALGDISYAWDTASLSSAGTITVVPEPGTAISLLGGMGILLGLRRRR